MKLAFSFILVILIGFPAIAQNTNKAESDIKVKQRTYSNQRKGTLNSGTKKIEEEEQEELDAIVDEMEAMDPNSYEYNLTTYVNANYSGEHRENLLKAYEINPNAVEVQKEMMALYVIEGNKAKQTEFAKKLQGQYSENRLNYFRDLLPTSNSGFLVVSNKADAYPLYVLQLIKNEKSAVKVITLDFLKNDGYRAEVQQMTGIGQTQFLGDEKGFITKLLSSSNKDVYISATVNQNYLSRVSDGTYLTGLSYEYNVTDQKAELESFWGEVKKKDLSAIKLNSSQDKRLYGNYLPPLLTLYKLKKLNGESDSTLRSTIEALATKINKAETVKSILKDYDMN